MYRGHSAGDVKQAAGNMGWEVYAKTSSWDTFTEILLAVIKVDEAVQGTMTEKSKEPEQALEKCWDYQQSYFYIVQEDGEAHKTHLYTQLCLLLPC